MSTQQVDILNIGLIAIAAVLAYFFPLELFILAFAILGPLHYLTEINWLDYKKYFTPGARTTWLAIGLLASGILVAPRLYFEFFGSDGYWLTPMFAFISKWSNGAILLTLLLALGYLLVKRPAGWVALTAVGIALAIFLNDVDTYAVFIGLLVPTVIHVYIFTLLFMLYGARKSGSSYGYLSIALAMVVPLVFVMIDVDASNYTFSDGMKTTYIENNLHRTPALFAKFIGLSDGTTFFFYEKMELKLMMFMSFIYLYHYLNWFSKTTTISWHKNLTLKRSLIILALWIGMLSLFLVDYRLGFLTALFFSFLHVILEFPLNMISIRAIFAAK